MIRVVADANVLISAALARDPSAPSVLILDAALEGRVEFVSSPVLLGEVVSVLGRRRLRRYLSLDEAHRFVTNLAALTTVVSDPPPAHPAISRDPADDYLVALARATGSRRLSAATSTFFRSPTPTRRCSHPASSSIAFDPSNEGPLSVMTSSACPKPSGRNDRGVDQSAVNSAGPRREERERYPFWGRPGSAGGSG